MRKLLLAASLIGCTLAPHYHRPPLPVQDRFPGGGGSLVAADQGWRKMFGDPRLQALIALALANNRDLRVAALNVELTRAQFRIQRAQLVPTVGGLAVGSRAGGGAAGGGSAGALPIPARFYVLGVSASYELDLFGRVRSLTVQALEQYLSTVEGHRAAHLALVGQVVTQYLSERSYAEQYGVAVGTEVTTRQTYELTKQLFEDGQKSELDVRATEAQWQNARAQVQTLWRQWVQAVDALVVLVGQPLPANLPPPQPLTSQQMIADLAPGIPSQVLLRRPDVVEAEHALRAANANIGAARAMFFPNISLTGLAATLTSAFDKLFSSGTGLFLFSTMITQPLFTGGANIANLDAAHVQKDIRIAQYEKTIQTAFREVADALVARETFERQLAAQIAQVQAQQVRFDLSQERYREGVASYLDVLTAQNDLYSAQLALISLRADRLTNLADLYRALGGGWREY
ncbi:MAG: efflux system, outer rane lipoprotein NodT family [Myxococcales bacterium]|nr:efflux system, outer rane lipoprotein NodT family [Myxococcales bacterium]